MVYVEAVRDLKDLLLFDGVYQRPGARAQARFSTAGGSRFKRPPADRLVPIEDDFAAHAAAAGRLPFPSAYYDDYTAEDLACAARACVREREHLEGFRAARLARITTIADSLTAFGAVIAALAVGTQAELVAGMNLAFLAAFIDASAWPDVALVERFVRGFPIVGTIADSGLFRPQHTPATRPPSTLEPASNLQWTQEVKRRVARKAARASGRDRRILQGVAKVTRTEARKGYVRGPFSAAKLDRIFGRGQWRPMIRFGAEQGSGPTRKIRAIDNAKSALINACTATHETITCISFEFAAACAHLVYLACVAARIAMLPMVIGLDDLTAAYRFIPVYEAWFTVFCVSMLDPAGAFTAPQFFYLPGHNFGCVASVLNFNRFPHVMVYMSRVLLAIMVDHYFDDYMTLDLQCGGTSAQDCLAALHVILARDLAADKHKPPASRNVGLGLMIDVSRVHSDMSVIVTCTWDRCDKVLAMLRSARTAKWLAPGTAAVARGKLGFLLTAAYGRVGRAASQPLVQREFADATYGWTDELEAMLQFLEVLLPVLPALELPVALAHDTRPPIVVYTDAMFRYRGGRPFSRMGYVIFDPGDAPSVGGADAVHTVVHCDELIPDWVFALFSPNKKTYIMQAELLAMVWPYFSMPSRFRGRRVIHMADNFAALSAVVHGYARKPDAARLVNAFHLLMAALRVSVWFEWVPSKANCADLPSRADDPAAYPLYFSLFPSSVRGPSRLPHIGSWDDSVPLSAVLRAMFARAAE